MPKFFAEVFERGSQSISAMPKLVTTLSSKIVTRGLNTLPMPAFTLYSARGSFSTDSVRLTLAKGGPTDYQVVLLDLRKGEQKVNG